MIIAVKILKISSKIASQCQKSIFIYMSIGLPSQLSPPFPISHHPDHDVGESSNP